MKFDLDLTDEQQQPEPTPESPPGDPAEIINPFTGEVVATTDIDGLVDMLEQLCKSENAAALAKREITAALVAKTDAEKITTKTRRVRGNLRRVKITMPDTSWDQGILKEVFNAWPQWRDTFLRIERLAPKMKEINKARSESGPEDYNACVQMIVKAEKPSTGMPSISIEE